MTLYFLVILWVLIQWLPAPVVSWGNPVWLEASAALERELAPRITVNPGATLAALVNLLAYGAVFWLALHLTIDSDRARQARNALMAIGGAYALYGFFAWFGGMGWIDNRLASSDQRPFSSTFVNRNSFATFAGLTLLCTVTICFERIRHILSITRPLRQKAALTIETIVFHSGWVTAAMLATGIALLLTASRGGILATAAALVALIALQLKPGNAQARHRGVIVMLFLVAARHGTRGRWQRFHRTDRPAWPLDRKRPTPDHLHDDDRGHPLGALDGNRLWHLSRCDRGLARQ